MAIQDLVMNRGVLRAAFILPALLITIGVLQSVLGESSLPAQAREYLGWYRSQPLPAAEWVLNKIAILGLLGVVLFSIGLAFFSFWARYGYVASTLLALGLEVFNSFPLLVTPRGLFIDDVAQILIGINIAIMFVSPAASYFSQNRVAKNP